MNKNEILDAVENGCEVYNRFGDEVASGYRIENSATSFKLSDGTVIRFDQVANCAPYKIILK